jgi:D-glycero-D-manno-heptose 1,7-bisphosphate phosphatase
MSRRHKAVFLDRDGVINENLNGYVHKLTDLRFTPGAGAALADLKAQGYLLVVITNQSGVARGMYTEADVAVFHGEMQRQLKQDHDVAIDRFYVCPHLPEGSVKEYAVKCTCRKPGNKHVLQAIDDLNIDKMQSFFVGDSESDIDCAMRSGVRGLQIASPGKSKHPDAYKYFKTFAEATKFILSL